MTVALTTTQPPAPMRILDSPIGKVIPVTDITDNIGYSRGSITNILTKHSELLKGLSIVKTLPTPGGDQSFLCLNYDGVERVLLLMRPAKTKKDLCERQAILRAKSFERLAESRVSPATVEIDIDTELLKAKHLAEQTGGDVSAFQAIALKKCGMEDYIPALKQTPNLIHGEKGWYNVTQFCKMFPLAAIEGHPERLNNYLQNQGYIYRENGKPRLQPKGEPHGKEYWFESPHGHREIRIRWRLSIMYACGLVKDDPAPISTAQIRAAT